MNLSHTQTVCQTDPPSIISCPKIWQVINVVIHWLPLIWTSRYVENKPNPTTTIISCTQVSHRILPKWKKLHEIYNLDTRIPPSQKIQVKQQKVTNKLYIFLKMRSKPPLFTIAILARSKNTIWYSKPRK